MKLIVNTSKNWGIGKENSLLFHFKQDMRFFRQHTVGNVVVMGRKTLDSFPGGKPLPDRVNIVLTRNPEFSRDDVIICHTVGELRAELKKYDSDRIYIIGGASVYREFLPFCDTAYVTRVDAVKDADTFMADLDESPDWEIIDKSEVLTEKEYKFQFVTYKNIRKQKD